MSHSFTSITSAQFDVPISNTSYSLLKALREARPSAQHVPTLDTHASAFPILEYLRARDVAFSVVEPDTYGFFKYNAAADTVERNVIVGVFEFTYDGTPFTAYHAFWTTGFGAGSALYDLVFEAADDAPGKELAAAVYRWAGELKDELWVFEGGMWVKSKALYDAVRATRWDDVVLEASFRDGLRRDTETFFSSRQIYKSLGITWKRGLLLLGPPGNGKTESIKTLLNDFDCAALYVKSISTPRGPEDGVRRVFEFARKQSPCILVLEDLDSMITGQVRSFFLNELDGLAQNEGILTIATTNHPERIDDAILNRPSRFDVKYNFALPTQELRKMFALKWLAKTHALGPDTGVSFEKSDEELAIAVAEKTNEWSFAFLKDFVSFFLRLAHDRSLKSDASTAPADQVLLDQADKLSEQIMKVGKDAGNGEEDNAGARVHAPFQEPRPYVYGSVSGFAVC
ncbi:P-loop containing nucleoside triphosphate hydrolase protein [Amylocystis lapponica]|nr:P-loop containing nucleoside triphosphate hydrolase protein [Amylocystis lapponica]